MAMRDVVPPGQKRDRSLRYDDFQTGEELAWVAVGPVRREFTPSADRRTAWLRASAPRL